MPTRRLVGGAALFGRWSRAAQPEELFREIIELGSAGELLNELRARSESGFWAWHYDFDVPTKGPRPWQIGRLRASEILVNVVLPLGYAVGRRRDWPDLSAAALLAYRRLPAAPWNRVTRAMAGLLRLFKRWCWERRCETCPAGAGRERRR